MLCNHTLTPQKLQGSWEKVKHKKYLWILWWLMNLLLWNSAFKFTLNLSCVYKGCVEYNTYYSGHNIYNLDDKTANTEQLCQIACQQHPDCSWWSLNVVSWDGYGCWLKSQKNLNKKEIRNGYSFGPKFCGTHFLWIRVIINRTYYSLI